MLQKKKYIAFSSFQQQAIPLKLIGLDTQKSLFEVENSQQHSKIQKPNSNLGIQGKFDHR